MQKFLSTVFVATLATMPMWAENDEAQELSVLQARYHAEDPALLRPSLPC